MALVKYLKLMGNYPITLFSGRTDFKSVYFAPDDANCIKKYHDIVDTNVDSVNYNEFVFQDYIGQNILCIISIPTADATEPPPQPPTMNLQFEVIA